MAGIADCSLQNDFILHTILRDRAKLFPGGWPWLLDGLDSSAKLRMLCSTTLGDVTSFGRRCAKRTQLSMCFHIPPQRRFVPEAYAACVPPQNRGKMTTQALWPSWPSGHQGTHATPRRSIPEGEPCATASRAIHMKFHPFAGLNPSPLHTTWPHETTSSCQSVLHSS